MKRKTIAQTNNVTLYQTQLDIFVIQYGNDIKQTTDIHKALSLFTQAVRFAILKELTQCSM